MNKPSKAKNKKPHMPFAFRVIRFMFSRLGPVFPNYFANRAYDLWFSTQRFKTPAKELPAKKSAVTSTMDIQGLPVAIYTWGTADKKVLFIHGWSGRGTQCAGFIQPLLNAGYQVMSFDGPAHGQTPGNQSSVLQFADTLVLINERYGPFDAAITHSFGGMALAYAMSSGFSIDRIVCVCPPDNFDVIINNFKKALALPDAVAAIVFTKFYATHGFSLPHRISTVENVKALSNEALVIHDEDDTDLGWQCGKNVADAWPNAKFIKTSGLGHRRIIRDPGVIKTTVDFITR